MKITKSALKQLIKEELTNLKEQLGGSRKVAGAGGVNPVATRQHQGVRGVAADGAQINQLGRQLHSATDKLVNMSGTDEKVVYDIRNTAAKMIEILEEVLRALEETDLQSRRAPGFQGTDANPELEMFDYRP